MFQVSHWDLPLSQEFWEEVEIAYPTPSIGSQGRNVPFREDVLESAIKTTVSVANCHPLVSPLLETVDGNE